MKVPAPLQGKWGRSRDLTHMSVTRGLTNYCVPTSVDRIASPSCVVVSALVVATRSRILLLLWSPAAATYRHSAASSTHAPSQSNIIGHQHHLQFPQLMAGEGYRPINAQGLRGEGRIPNGGLALHATPATPATTPATGLEGASQNDDLAQGHQPQQRCASGPGTPVTSWCGMKHAWGPKDVPPDRPKK